MTAGGGVRVSAPGKLILAGEHAAVYGKPALVTALDLRASARLRGAGGSSTGLGPGEIAIDLPTLGVRQRSSWRRVREVADQARADWEQQMRQPGRFRPLFASSAASLVEITLGEAVHALAVGLDLPAAHLTVTADLPSSAGFGSSAAVASAVAGAVSAWVAGEGARSGSVLEGGELGRLENMESIKEIEKIVLEVERRQHGNPSGVDGATVLRGGVLWCAREGGRLQAQPLPEASRALGELGGFGLVHTGAAGDSTGEVVAGVRARYDAEPQRIGAVIERIAEGTLTMRSALVRRSAADMLGAVREIEACLELLGVVPEPVVALVRRIEELGGAAKVSGAGSARGPGAGAVLVYHPSPERLARLRTDWPESSGTWIEARIGAPGLRREPLESGG